MAKAERTVRCSDWQSARSCRTTRLRGFSISLDRNISLLPTERDVRANGVESRRDRAQRERSGLKRGTQRLVRAHVFAQAVWLLDDDAQLMLGVVRRSAPLVNSMLRRPRLRADCLFERVRPQA